MFSIHLHFEGFLNLNSPKSNQYAFNSICVLFQIDKYASIHDPTVTTIQQHCPNRDCLYKSKFKGLSVILWHISFAETNVALCIPKEHLSPLIKQTLRVVKDSQYPYTRWLLLYTTIILKYTFTESIMLIVTCNCTL